MTNLKSWPQTRYPIIFRQVLVELPDDLAPMRINAGDTPWSVGSLRIRLHGYCRRFGPTDRLWRITEVDGSYVLVSCRIRGARIERVQAG